VKRAVKRVGIGFIIAAGLLGGYAPDANASPQSDYVGALRTEGGVGPDVTDAQMLELGAMVCQKLSDGATKDEIIQKFDIAVPGKNLAATLIVDDAVQYLCPDQGDSA
jgi:Protein of unknown function (DUF732)